MSNIIVCKGAEHIGVKSTVQHVSKLFTNGEVFIQIPNGSINDKEVHVIQSFSLPNTHLMELMCTIDACKRSGASKIHVLLPYFPYSRMDQRHDTGTPISAKVVADMISSVNPDSVISFDLHAPQIQGFFDNNIQFKHVQMGAFFTHHIKKDIPDFGDDSWSFVSPDSGSVKRTKNFATLSNNRNLCHMIKYRAKAQEIEEMNLIGDVNGKNVVLFDDMIDTGGTLNKAISILKDNGANKVIALATHGIFSDKEKAHKNLDNIFIYVTDSVKGFTKPNNTHVLSIKNFIHEIISMVDNSQRLGQLNSSVPTFV